MTLHMDITRWSISKSDWLYSLQPKMEKLYTVEVTDSGIRSGKHSAWRSMDRGSYYCTGGTDQNHPKEKEMQEDKLVVWRGFTNNWGKKRSKNKGEKERYTEPNAEFKRIGRKDKKAFFNEQCKEIEENKRRGKTRDLFKKIGNIEHFMQIWAQ